MSLVLCLRVGLIGQVDWVISYRGCVTLSTSFCTVWLVASWTDNPRWVLDYARALLVKLRLHSLMTPEICAMIGDGGSISMDCFVLQNLDIIVHGLANHRMPCFVLPSLDPGPVLLQSVQDRCFSMTHTMLLRK